MRRKGDRAFPRAAKEDVSFFLIVRGDCCTELQKTNRCSSRERALQVMGAIPVGPGGAQLREACGRGMTGTVVCVPRQRPRRGGGGHEPAKVPRPGKGAWRLSCRMRSHQSFQSQQ